MKDPEKPIYAYYNEVVKRGTKAEREDLLAELGLLSALKREFPKSTYMPMDHVRVIQALLDEADALARDRYEKAVARHYRDTQGKVGRSEQEEIENTRGQYALQIMLGLPLGKPDTPEQAKIVGNAGEGHNAFVPFQNPIRHHLIVQRKHRDDGIWWLVVPEGGGYYRLKGWITAGAAKKTEYRRWRTREGGQSDAYWVPPHALNSVASWWKQ